MGRVDVQKYSEKLERELEKIKESEDIAQQDKDTLEQFTEYRKQNSSDGRIRSELNRLKRTLEHNYPSHTLADILEDQDVFEKINTQISQSEMHNNNGDYANSTKDEYRKAWKRLLEYHYRNQSQVEAFLPRNYSQNTHSLGENIDPRKTPGAEDVKQICQALEALSDAQFAKRNVAACMTMWDLGCRISAIGRMKVEDVTYRNGKIEEIMVPAVKKSPQRPVELTVAQPALQDYLENVHPAPDKPNAPLFTALKGEPRIMNVDDFRQKLRQARNHTGLNVKFNPHNWRRGRGTFLVTQNIFDVRTAATRGGWTKIETLDGYLQQTMEGVNKKVKQVYKSEKVEDSVSGAEADLLPLKCPDCSELNSGHKDRCRSCDHVLDRSCIPEGVAGKSAKEQVQETAQQMGGMTPQQIENLIEQKISEES